jgi:hypothetical protein
MPQEGAGESGPAVAATGVSKAQASARAARNAIQGSLRMHPPAGAPEAARAGLVRSVRVLRWVIAVYGTATMTSSYSAVGTFGDTLPT